MNHMDTAIKGKWHPLDPSSDSANNLFVSEQRPDFPVKPHGDLNLVIGLESMKREEVRTWQMFSGMAFALK